MRLAAAPLPMLANLYLGAYLVHELTFFFLLCYRPVRNPVPRGDIVVQRLLRQAGPRNREAGAMGRSRRASWTR